jgi:hypothetical protein
MDPDTTDYEYYPDWPDDTEAQFDDDPNPYHGTYSEE